MSAPTDFNSMDQLLTFGPSLVLSAIGGLAKATTSEKELRVKVIWKMLVLSSFAGLVTSFILEDWGSFGISTKRAIICIVSYAASNILPMVENALKVYIKSKLPKAFSNMTSDYYDDYVPRRQMPQELLDEDDDDTSIPKIDFDNDNETYCTLPDPDGVKVPKKKTKLKPEKKISPAGKRPNGTKKNTPPE